MWPIFGRQKREGCFFFFSPLNKTTPSQDNSMPQIPNDYFASNHCSLEQPRWQGGDRLQTVMQKELEAKYRARPFNRLRQLKNPSHGPNTSAAVEAALRRSKIKQSQPFLLQHAVQETQSSEASRAFTPAETLLRAAPFSNTSVPSQLDQISATNICEAAILKWLGEKENNTRLI